MQLRTYHPKEVITFRKTTEPFGQLSNMSKGFPIVYRDTLYPTAEHLYQCLKFIAHPQIQAKIIQETNPFLAKKIAIQHHDYFDSKAWESKRIVAMRWVLQQKLVCNPAFATILLATGDKPIVEYCPKGSIWGAKYENNYLVGYNALGRLLMELREKQKGTYL